MDNPPAHPVGKSPGFNSTLVAILVAMVISLVLATVMTGNPFRAMVLAYTDYSHTPASGAPEASDTRAPDAMKSGK